MSGLVVVDLLVSPRSAEETAQRLEALPVHMDTVLDVHRAIVKAIREAPSQKEMFDKASTPVGLVIRDYLCELVLAVFTPLPNSPDGVARLLCNLFFLWISRKGGIQWIVNYLFWPYIQRRPNRAMGHLEAVLMIDELLTYYVSTPLEQTLGLKSPDLYTTHVNAAPSVCHDVIAIFLKEDRFEAWLADDQRMGVDNMGRLLTYALDLVDKSVVSWDNLARLTELEIHRKNRPTSHRNASPVLCALPLIVSQPLVDFELGVKNPQAHPREPNTFLFAAMLAMLQLKTPAARENAKVLLDRIEKASPGEMDKLTDMMLKLVFGGVHHLFPPEVHAKSSLRYINSPATVPWFHVAEAMKRNPVLLAKVANHKIPTDNHTKHLLARKASWVHWIETNKKPKEGGPWSPKPYRGEDRDVRVADVVLRKINKLPSTINALILSLVAGMDGPEGPPKELFAIMDNIKIKKVHARDAENEEESAKCIKV